MSLTTKQKLNVASPKYQWMSPEQQERAEDELSTGYLNEKIDVYALGKYHRT